MTDSLPEMTRLTIRCEFAGGASYEVDITKPVHPEIEIKEEDGSTRLLGAASYVLEELTSGGVHTLRPRWTFSISGTAALKEGRAVVVRSGPR